MHEASGTVHRWLINLGLLLFLRESSLHICVGFSRDRALLFRPTSSSFLSTVNVGVKPRTLTHFRVDLPFFPLRERLLRRDSSTSRPLFV